MLATNNGRFLIPTQQWRSDGAAGRTGRHLLGAATGRKTPKIQIVSFMCLRARKAKRYGQRVPIVSYYVGY